MPVINIGEAIYKCRRCGAELFFAANTRWSFWTKVPQSGDAPTALGNPTPKYHNCEDLEGFGLCELVGFTIREAI